MELKFDLNKLTVGDLEDLEGIAGIAVEDIDFSKPSAKVIKAIVYLVGRRDNPDFTIEDARAVPLSEISVPEMESDPTSGEAAS